jgi:2-dehydropantoate 2-reductase
LDNKSLSHHDFEKNKEEAPLVVVVGTGAIGGTLACLLSRSGCDVQCVSSSLGLKRINASGMVLNSSKYGEVSFNLTTKAFLTKRPRLVIFATRSNQLDTAMTAINRNKVAGVPIISVTSGYKELEKLRDFFGNSVCPSKIDFYAFRSEINTINHVGGSIRIKAGNKFFSERQKLEEIAYIFRNAGIDFDTTDYENDCLWEDFIPYVSASLYCAFSNEKLDYILKDKDLSKELYSLTQEIVKIARTLGFKGSVDASYNNIKKIPDDFVFPFVVDYKRDLTGEIKAFSLDLLNLAQKNRVSCDLLKKISTYLIKNIEKGKFPEGHEIDFEEIVPENIDDDMFVLELSDEEYAIVMDQDILSDEKEEITYKDLENEIATLSEDIDQLSQEIEESEGDEKSDTPQEKQKAWHFYNQIN